MYTYIHSMRVFPGFLQDTQGVPLEMLAHQKGRFHVCPGPAPSECQRSENLTLPWTTDKTTTHRSSCFPKEFFFCLTKELQANPQTPPIQPQPLKNLDDEY